IHSQIMLHLLPGNVAVAIADPTDATRLISPQSCFPVHVAPADTAGYLSAPAGNNFHPPHKPRVRRGRSDIRHRNPVTSSAWSVHYANAPALHTKAPTPPERAFVYKRCTRRCFSAHKPDTPPPAPAPVRLPATLGAPAHPRPRCRYSAHADQHCRCPH